MQRKIFFGTYFFSVCGKFVFQTCKLHQKIVKDKIKKQIPYTKFDGIHLWSVFFSGEGWTGPIYSEKLIF